MHTVVTMHPPSFRLTKRPVLGVDIILDDLILAVPYHLKFLLSLVSSYH